MMKRPAYRPKSALPVWLHVLLRPLFLVPVLLIWLLVAGSVVWLAADQQTSELQQYRKLHQETAERLAATISSDIGQWERQLESLAARPELQTMIEQSAAGQAPDQQALNALWPDAEQICLLNAIPLQPVLDGCLPISYASLLALRQLDQLGKADVAVILPGSEQAYVLLLHRLDETASAILMVALSPQHLQQMLQQHLTEGGYAELQQGSQQQIMIARAGDPRWQSQPAFIQSVPFSHWQLAYWAGNSKPAMQLPLVGLVLGLTLLTLLWILLFQRLQRYFPSKTSAPRKAQSAKETASTSPVNQRPKPVDEQDAELKTPAARKVLTESGADDTQPEISAAIFKTYDIRGIVGETLNKKVLRQLGRTIGSEAVQRGIRKLVLARDGRLSSDSFSKALTEGLMAAGCSVIDIGAVPTPVLYFACDHLGTQSGVMVTGSHNPADYNGLKIVLGGETLVGDSIQALYRRLQAADFTVGTASLEQQDVQAAYIEAVTSTIQLARPMRIVIDCGNGIAGKLAPKLFKALGCEVNELFCEVNGEFPNHHPDPGQPENMHILASTVQSRQAELGLAFDGDGDRIGVVDGSGKIIWPDQLLLLFAQDLLAREPGASIIFDVKCSTLLEDAISRAGGQPLMSASGHSVIKQRMRETGARLAGEMSGHLFFAERWYGFDDALYSAGRLLELLAADPLERTPSEVFAALPQRFSTPEIIVPMASDTQAKEFMARLETETRFTDARLITIDGLRVEFSNGWGLVRKSNTVPGLSLRFEATNEAALEQIKQLFQQQMLQIDPTMSLHF